MTPAALLTTLRARGVHVAVLDGDRLGVWPRAALDDGLRAELRAHKAEVVALLRRQAPADGSCTLRPCPTCGSAVFWRADGTCELRCAACVPCPDPRCAAWYTSPPANDPTAAVDVLFGEPAVRAALAWASRQAPALADAVIAAVAAVERLHEQGAALEGALDRLDRAVDAVVRCAQGLDQVPAVATPELAAPGWRLVVEHCAPVAGPVRLDTATVVQDVRLFVQRTLADIERAVAALNAGKETVYTNTNFVNEKLTRLAACGVVARVEPIQ